jgi:hypothetical protein
MIPALTRAGAGGANGEGAMKRLLAATAALLVAWPALAREMRCGVVDPKGQSIIYNFEGTTNGVFVETSITKNGSTLIHGQGRRPRWKTEVSPEGILLIVYLPDPRFAIYALLPKVRVSSTGTRYFPAALNNNDDSSIGRRGRGACVWVDEIVDDDFRPYE